MHTPPERRRVRAARSRLARVESQRERFATTYAIAQTPAERFNAVAAALRAAAAEKHQPDPTEANRRLDALTMQAKQLLDELHETQQQHATNTVRADERRIARNERRRHDRGTNPERAGVSAA